MNHREGFFQGLHDHQIYCQSWSPNGEPRAVLLIVHGLAEHSGRYMNLVNHFVPAGYALYAYDHPGHGRSDGHRAYVEAFQDFTATLDMAAERVRKWQPRKPVFLVGHSMGGLISADYLADYPHELAGAVLSGPGVKVPDDVSPAVIFIGKLLANILPRMGIVQLEAEGISRDPAVVAAYRDDPLVHAGKVTARLGAEMLKTMQKITRKAERLTLPIMIVQGGADSLVDPSGARDLYASLGADDKTLKIYDGLFHEVFNEPEHRQVLQDVARWLDAHSG